MGERLGRGGRLRPRPGRRPRPLSLEALLGGCLILLSGACVQPPPEPEWRPLPPPEPEGVDAVVFLVGDAGEAKPGASPVLERLRREVDAWSSRVARDSAVAVVYLGDIVYPEGVRGRGTPHFPEDSLRVRAQVDVVTGPAARSRGTRGLFLAGNHDWGEAEGAEGEARLRNLEALLRNLAAEQALPVGLLPAAGEPGPAVVELGTTARLVLVDTHWWLQPRERADELRVAAAVGAAMEGAGGRAVVVAAHHPWISGGYHGGPVPLSRGLGLAWLLRKTGALVQDLNSEPYRNLRARMSAAFADTRPPLAWAGGHDHSLQVLRTSSEDQPAWSIVSGAGSKLTGVADVPGMEYGAERPGFVRLTFLAGGEVRLHVYAADEAYLLCEGEEAAVERCMAEGVPAFGPAWAGRLR